MDDVGSEFCIKPQGETAIGKNASSSNVDLCHDGFRARTFEPPVVSRVLSDVAEWAGCAVIMVVLLFAFDHVSRHASYLFSVHTADSVA